MVKNHYTAAIVTFALIPIVTLLGGLLFNFINPEIAAGYPNYERNYRLLDQAKSFVLFGGFFWIWFCGFWPAFFCLKPSSNHTGGCPWLCLARSALLF
jgi:hypothetical protein